jgi:hypothetical protein
MQQKKFHTFFFPLFIPHVLGGALIAHLDRSAPDLVCLPTSKRKRMRAGRGIDAVSDSVSHLKDILLHTEGMGLRGWAISADVSFELAHVDHFSHHIRGMAIVDTAWNRGFRQYLLPGVMNAIKEMGG